MMIVPGYSPDGEPNFCTRCGCSEFVEKVTDRIDGYPCEKMIYCKACDLDVAYWSYGQYHPDYYITEGD
ncbi:hypothetical protein PMW_80 [Pseudomonas phage phiPMW]|uniref:Uncharacterized protein n=1 Tax=Pseudomonas phage phiPMW TaxID=1815582 RepID=A0A1S5R1B6_9CAUD|nr:hypothetical protein FDG97_gp080 [Pseudomonas phage phiPMW]ANA49205.1 hypothetical protein PMW_80 [Pseudomonas phage phiPMW]